MDDLFESDCLNGAVSNDIAGVLQARIVGQDHAKDRIIGKILESDYMGLTKKGPRASLLLLGDSGLGKGYMAHVLAEGLGHQQSFFELDMASLTHEFETQELNGSEQSWSNASPGRLTDFVRRNPQATILLKNIDRAHPALIRLVSGLLAEGRLRDKFGFYKGNDPDNKEIANRVVDFSQAVIIMTCSSLEPFWNSPSFAESFEQESERIYEMAHGSLSRLESFNGKESAFDQTFLDAVGLSGLVIFRRISLKGYAEIAKRRSGQLIASLSDANNFVIEPPSENILRLAALCAAPDIKAGRVESKVFEMFFKPILKALSDGVAFKNVSIEIDNGAIKHMADLSDQFGYDVVDHVFKKNTRVWADIEIETVDEKLTLIIKAVSSGKNVSLDDSSAAGSVSFQVPDLSFSDIAGHVHIK